MLIGDIATNNARRYPDKRALVDADRALTWSQVDERARRLAAFLIGRGLAPGDRVMVLARNCIEWPEISFGLAKAGLVAVPVNVRLAPDEVAHVRDDAAARGVIVHAADTSLVTEANRSDVMLATTPFFTAGGMVRTVSWLYLGQTMVIHQRFDPQAVIDEIERSAITFTTFIPTMLHRTLAILEDGPPRDM